MKQSHKIILGLGGVVLVYIAWYYYRSRYGNRTIWQGPVSGHGYSGKPGRTPDFIDPIKNYLGNRTRDFTGQASPHPHSFGEDVPFIP